MSWIKSKYYHFYNSLSKRGFYSFGLISLVLFSWLLYKNLDFTLLPFYLISFGILIQLAGFIWLEVLRVEFAIFSLITYPIGWLISTVTLAVVYFVIVVPMKLFKKNYPDSKWVDSQQEIDPSKMYE